MACGTTGGKAFIHDAHNKLHKGDTGSRLLNLNREVTCLAAGNVGPAGGAAQLAIGGATSLQLYDSLANRDVFYKDVPDGVSAAAVGRVDGVEGALALVGGNCTVQGFAASGAEEFWTVTGDEVAVMQPIRSASGKAHLLVGSADFELRWLSSETAVAEATETARPLALAPVLSIPGKVLYSLDNGTVGMYTGHRRSWRLKTKSTSHALTSFDMTGDGVEDVLVGWASGTVEARRADTGALISKDVSSDPIAGLVAGDYRGDGRRVALAVTASGAVRGYTPATGEQDSHGAQADADLMASLRAAKSALDRELRTVEVGLKATTGAASVAGAASIPASTSVSLTLQLNGASGQLELVASTNNDCVINTMVVFSFDGVLFPGESQVLVPPTPSRTARVPLTPQRDAASTATVQVMVALRPSSTAFHVFEAKQDIPKFAAYAYQGARQPPAWQAPPGHVSCIMVERAARLAMWVAQSFVVPEGAGTAAADGSYSAYFTCLRDGSGLHVSMQPKDPSAAVGPTGGASRVTVACSSMETAGDILQGIAAYFGVGSLRSEADFPQECGRVAELAEKVGQLSALRQRFSAEMADASHGIKLGVVKAEDARLLGDMTGLKRNYAELMAVNEQLLGEYSKRASHHTELVGALKELNGYIQKASRLRVGEPATACVAACREAIRKTEFLTLPRVMMSGE